MEAEYMGCIFRIRSCASDLLLMEDDVIDNDEDLWELIGREIRLKTNFLFCDLNRVISRSKGNKRKKSLSDLGNKLFYFMEELDDAVKSRDVSLTQVCYSNTTHALQEVMAALLSPNELEYWKISCIALRRRSEKERQQQQEEGEREGEEERTPC
ncbi:photosynthetic NDH subunit of lumenal location 3, chloroplastic-like [Typha angustifolia]|uniref:photosynthetic NDH subunit of lumenal location 3, chloroplastic-like n=1 Tax=Typha angustifolia TaxID=59011 RepID=UPI003C2FB76B